METIFWMQADSPIAEDFFFVDGERIGSESPQAKEAYNRIRKCHEYSRFDKKRVIQWRKELNNEYFILYYIPFSGLFYQSVVKELASDGRKKTVTIWISSPTFAKFNSVARTTDKIGYTFRENELCVVNSLIERHIKQHKIIKKIIIFVLFIFVVSLFLIIF